MLEYLAVMLLGVASGVITGLIPGLHPNTVVFSSLPVYFSTEIDFIIYMCFISGLSVSHTFHDFLPAIIFGIPEADTALSSLPGARMAAEGRAKEAFLYTVSGGLFSVLFLIFLSPLVFYGLKKVYSALTPFMAYFLVFFLLFIVFKSENTFHAAITAVLSGALGSAAFSSPVNQTFVLMPVFTGLFAAPAVITMLGSGFKPPEQLDTPENVTGSARGGALGLIAGMTAGIFPGIGAATSTSMLAPMMDSRKQFLAGLGGVNTSDILVSFMALYLLGKARSGPSVALKAVSGVGLPELAFLAGISITAVSVSAVVALELGPRFIEGFTGLDLRRLAAFVLGGLAAMSFWLTGPLGLLILVTSALVGYSAALKGNRAACMAVLIVPAISFYSTGLFLYI